MARSTHQTPGVLSRRPAGSRISEESQVDESGRSESSENASFSPPAHAPPGAASPSWKVIACAAAVVSLGTLNQIAGKIRSKPLGQFDYFVSLCNAVLYFTVYTLALVLGYRWKVVPRENLSFVWPSLFPRSAAALSPSASAASESASLSPSPLPSEPPYCSVSVPSPRCLPAASAGSSSRSTALWPAPFSSPLLPRHPVSSPSSVPAYPSPSSPSSVPAYPSPSSPSPSSPVSAPFGAWRLFVLTGLCDACGNILGFIAQPYVPGPLFSLATQAIVPFSCLCSLALLRRRYSCSQLAALLLVTVGFFVAWCPLVGPRQRLARSLAGDAPLWRAPHSLSPHALECGEQRRPPVSEPEETLSVVSTLSQGLEPSAAGEGGASRDRGKPDGRGNSLENAGAQEARAEGADAKDRGAHGRLSNEAKAAEQLERSEPGIGMGTGGGGGAQERAALGAEAGGRSGRLCDEMRSCLRSPLVTFSLFRNVPYDPSVFVPFFENDNSFDGRCLSPASPASSVSSAPSIAASAPSPLSMTQDTASQSLGTVGSSQGSSLGRARQPGAARRSSTRGEDATHEADKNVRETSRRDEKQEKEEDRHEREETAREEWREDSTPRRSGEKEITTGPSSRMSVASDRVSPSTRNVKHEATRFSSREKKPYTSSAVPPYPSHSSSLSLPSSSFSPSSSSLSLLPPPSRFPPSSSVSPSSVSPSSVSPPATASVFSSRASRERGWRKEDGQDNESSEGDGSSPAVWLYMLLAAFSTFPTALSFALKEKLLCDYEEQQGRMQTEHSDSAGVLCLSESGVLRSCRAVGSASLVFSAGEGGASEDEEEEEEEERGEVENLATVQKFLRAGAPPERRRNEKGDRQTGSGDRANSGVRCREASLGGLGVSTARSASMCIQRKRQEEQGERQMGEADEERQGGEDDVERRRGDEQEKRQSGREKIYPRNLGARPASDLLLAAPRACAGQRMQRGEDLGGEKRRNGEDRERRGDSVARRRDSDEGGIFQRRDKEENQNEKFVSPRKSSRGLPSPAISPGDDRSELRYEEEQERDRRDVLSHHVGNMHVAGKQKLHVLVICAHGSFFQLVWILLSLPLSVFIGQAGDDTLPTYLARAFRCFVNDAGGLPPPLCRFALQAYCGYAAVNILFNVSLIGFVSAASSLLTFVCMKATLPLSIILYATFSWPLLDSQDVRVTSETAISLFLILLGIIWFHCETQKNQALFPPTGSPPCCWPLPCSLLFRFRR
ncbi:putative transmembrane protein [Toxoplasma gondii VEG]|uniref:Putative transmembrane protein n=1 Tax=Toxoplasma gondii (strain ATCC 50861 / VEG) TaxID=432359 RepID=V5BBB2_TOXGV|nr:putative transmembrane protein [Toxoplasma gondii VEG]CEL76316.1 TPA: hypothetical protein BN1205_069390 [Toxoplasma gondii VEG]